MTKEEKIQSAINNGTAQILTVEHIPNKINNINVEPLKELQR